MIFTIKFRRGPASEWVTDNPVLASGEPGLETDTRKFKIGDGVHAWLDLDYYLDQTATESVIAEMISDLAIEGVPGPAGEDGAQGPEGPQGPQGIQGIQGPPGTNGTNGSNGAQGIQGPPGEDGLDGADGADGSNGSDGVDGVDGEDGSPGMLYPLSEYGFVAASLDPVSAVSHSSGGPWVTRVWIPKNKAFSKLGVYVSSPGTAGSGLNAFALYSDSGNLISQTANDNNLWTVGGYVLRDLPAEIPAESFDRFVRVAIAMEGSTPDILYANNVAAAVFKGYSGHRRSWVSGSRSSGFPSTIDVVNEGTEYQYLPLVVLA